MVALRADRKGIAGGNMAGSNETTAAASSYLEVENRLRKKAKLAANSDDDCQSQNLESDGEAQPTITLRSESPTIVPSFTTQSATNSNGEEEMKSSNNNAKSGRWSLDEKLLFLYGLSVFGKGRWKKISTYVPDRSLVQIKSHAQKVLKRLDAGENVFLRLEEHQERVKAMVAEANKRRSEEEAKASLQPKRKRKRASTRKPPAPFAVLGASAASWDLVLPSDQANNPSGGSSPVPSLSAEDPPMFQESSPQQTSDTEAFPTEKELSSSELEASGAGAVIAAVAALCQLSAS